MTSLTRIGYPSPFLSWIGNCGWQFTPSSVFEAAAQQLINIGSLEGVCSAC
jgi:hypothetical protein